MVIVNVGEKVKGSAPDEGVSTNLKVWKRSMYETVSSTSGLNESAFGPRSGTARNVLLPAYAIPDPNPPSRFPATPFSRGAFRPERSVLEPGILLVANKTVAP